MNAISRHFFPFCLFCLVPLLFAASSHTRPSLPASLPSSKPIPSAILPLPKSFSEVNDYADMFSANTEKRLTHAIDAYKRKSGLELMVMTIGSLRGDDINLYADRVLDASDKQALLIIARKEGKIALMLDEALEGRFSQTDAKRLISSDIVAHFQTGHYDEGIEAAINTLIKTLGSAPLHKAK